MVSVGNCEYGNRAPVTSHCRQLLHLKGSEAMRACTALRLVDSMLSSHAAMDSSFCYLCPVPPHHAPFISLFLHHSLDLLRATDAYLGIYTCYRLDAWHPCICPPDDAAR